MKEVTADGGCPPPGERSPRGEGRQLVLEVHEEVVPEEALGGLMQVRDEAADVAVAAPALGGELLPQAVFSEAKESVLR